MSSQLKQAVTNGDHIEGANNAKIELVEYGDYQCSYCGLAYPVIKSAQKSLGHDLKFVFRNFPLSEEHPDALNAAKAAEAAALQNKFWEMHDALYENQDSLDMNSLIKHAKSLGLDEGQFERDMQNESVTTRIEADFESGIRSGVNGTPSFYVNGKKYEGDWQEEEEFKDFLRNQL